jgi:hypothetical protein
MSILRWSFCHKTPQGMHAPQAGQAYPCSFRRSAQKGYVHDTEFFSGRFNQTLLKLLARVTKRAIVVL